jgi:hypothetical protein
MHIDTSLLRGMIDKNDCPMNRKNSVHLLNSFHTNVLRASILSVGEAFGRMAEVRSISDCADAGAELRRLIMVNRLELYGFGTTGEAFRLGQELLKKDWCLTPVDSLIAACALTDPDCGVFVTEDDAMIKSRALLEEAKRRKRKILPSEAILRREKGNWVSRPLDMRLSSISRRYEVAVDESADMTMARP